jgi:hypothetical protein
VRPSWKIRLHRLWSWRVSRSDFKDFASTFRLPSKHVTLAALKELADAVGEWWAEACVREAEKGHGHKVLRRLFDVALGTGVDKDHPKLIRAIRIINDRLAMRVLDEAKKRQELDTAHRDADQVILFHGARGWQEDLCSAPVGKAL